MLLPTVPLPTFHVGFVVRARTPEPTTIERLTVAYDSVDGFFLVQSPALAPGASGPEVIVTPRVETSVRARATDPTSDARLPDAVAVELSQDGRPVPSNESADPVRRGRVFGLLNAGAPVTVRMRNDSDAPVPGQLVIEWT